MGSSGDEQEEKEDDGDSPSSTTPSASSTFSFIDGVRGRKVLLYDGNIFHFHSTVKQSTYFKCSQKQKGCTASITVKNFDKKDCSYDSYTIVRDEHLNHLPNAGEISKKQEKLRQNVMLERSSEDVSSEVIKGCQHVCLFCLTSLPPGYHQLSRLENVLPSGDILTVSLEDPVKNSLAFDVLCGLLNVRWRGSLDGPHFDQRKCLPLCSRCQNLYQTLIQVHQQIRELEVLLNKCAKTIRDEVARTERERRNGIEIRATQLRLLGLDVFRKQVVDGVHQRLGREFDKPATLTKSIHCIKNRSNSSVASTTTTIKVDDQISIQPSNFEMLSDLPLVKQEVQDVDEALEDAESSWIDATTDDSNSPLPQQEHNHDDHERSDDITCNNSYPAKANLAFQKSETKRCTRSSSRINSGMKRSKRESSNEHLSSDYDDGRGATELKQEPSDDDVDSDSEFEFTGYSSSKSRHKRRVASNSLSRYRKRRTVKRDSHSTSSKHKKINICHICSARITGHKAFWDHYKKEHPEDKRYSCKFCRKHYIRLRDVVIHQRSHTGEKPFQCVTCDEAFVSSSLLRLHNIHRHTESIFPCPQCDKEFKSKIILENHLTATHGAEPKFQIYKKSQKPVKTMTCHLCDVKIMGAGPFIQHYKDVHPEEKRFTCKFCKRHFPYIRRVIIHQRTHTGEKPFSCQDCDKCFINAAGLRYHRATTHVTDLDKTYQCPLCPKRYSLKAALTGHMYSHREYVVVCKSCGKVFRTQCSFHKHNRIFHEGKALCTEPITNPNKETLESLDVAPGIQCRKKCHVCMAPIPGKVFIEKHFEECHPDHPGDFKTCRCGQQFKSYKEVYKHALRKHTDDHEKPYQCDKCPYSCLTSTELKSHCNTHIPVEERQKSHICDTCGLGLATHTALVKHMKKHTDGSQPKFVCELCGKSYVEKRGLHQHKKTNHWKILPHKCHYEGCGKAFPLKSILLRHLNVHTGENSYKCGECGKNFHYQNSLARHMKEVHGHGEGQTPRKRKGRKVRTVAGGVGKEERVEAGLAGFGGKYSEGHGRMPEMGPMDYRNATYRHHQQHATGFFGGFGGGNSVPPGGGMGHEQEMKPEHE